jgi:hypothetical protein
VVVAPQPQPTAKVAPAPVAAAPAKVAPASKQSPPAKQVEVEKDNWDDEKAPEAVAKAPEAVVKAEPVAQPLAAATPAELKPSESAEEVEFVPVKANNAGMLCELPNFALCRFKLIAASPNPLLFPFIRNQRRIWKCTILVNTWTLCSLATLVCFYLYCSRLIVNAPASSRSADAGKSTISGQILWVTPQRFCFPPTCHQFFVVDCWRIKLMNAQLQSTPKYLGTNLGLCSNTCSSLQEAKDKNRETWYLAYIMDTNEEERNKARV